MCEKTPFLFSATTDHNNLQYYWDFGDDSYNVGDNLSYVW